MSKHTNWYKDAIIYQIYPRSFKDSNDDGIGDIKGIISKLDYLKQLGINCIWLSPIYDSPQKDNGYDIANYKDIYKPFGTLNDVKELIKKAHNLGIKIVMDLVVNHTSDQHKWFLEATKDKNSPYHDYYIFKKGRKNNKLPPNNWSGFFAEGAWSKVNDDADEYYLHLFAKEQPDLNWENEKVRQEVVDILRFWLDLGVDGFRCDVINLISKKQDFKNRIKSLALTGKDAYINGPRLHEYLHELYEKALKDYDCFTVGETVFCNMNDFKLLCDPKREELDMAFSFEHTDCDNYFGVKYLKRKFSLKRFKKVINKWEQNIDINNIWYPLFLENHDQRRCVGRFLTDDGKYRKQSATMLATCYMLLKGTPFIYQGQEIGMTNANFTNISELKDVEAFNMLNLCNKNEIISLLMKKNIFDLSRDNARTPMCWDNSQYAGFSNHEPWIRVNPNKDKINVEKDLSSHRSVFKYYQKLIDIRKQYKLIKEGKFKLLYKQNKNLFIYERKYENESLIVICSFKKDIVKLPKKLFVSLSNYEKILGNTNNDKIYLMPYEARVYYKKS